MFLGSDRWWLWWGVDSDGREETAPRGTPRGKLMKLPDPNRTEGPDDIIIYALTNAFKAPAQHVKLMFIAMSLLAIFAKVPLTIPRRSQWI